MEWQADKWPDFAEREMRCRETGECEMSIHFMNRLQALMPRDTPATSNAPWVRIAIVWLSLPSKWDLPASASRKISYTWTICRREITPQGPQCGPTDLGDGLWQYQVLMKKK